MLVALRMAAIAYDSGDSSVLKQVYSIQKFVKHGPRKYYDLVSIY